MSNKHPERCNRSKQVRWEFENLIEATHRMEERSNIRDELGKAESSVSEDVERLLREKPEKYLDASAQEASQALFDWLLSEDETDAYNYEYIQKMGTLLNTIALKLSEIAANKSGISEQNRDTIQQSIRELLKEIFIRNC